MAFPLDPSTPPMEARSVAAIPSGRDWLYEPKYDGFRCLAYRDGKHVELRSKSGQPLGRYFPEVVAAVASVRARRFILDGELVVPDGRGLSFGSLQLRLHPAASRVAKLSIATPARYLVFDLLADGDDILTEAPLAERREALAAFAAVHFPKGGLFGLSQATRDRARAERWFMGSLPGLDGVIAKRLDQPYLAGTRDGMVKIKRIRTADCVVGGFRYGTGLRLVGSLLLGLHDDAGLLHHVGFTATLPKSERPALTKRLESLISPPGFTGNAPGGPSRWSTQRSTEWQPLKPDLVVEVTYDHVTDNRFRHGTTLQRWRPDKRPDQCTLAQIR